VIAPVVRFTTDTVSRGLAALRGLTVVRPLLLGMSPDAPAGGGGGADVSSCRRRPRPGLQRVAGCGAHGRAHAEYRVFEASGADGRKVATVLPLASAIVPARATLSGPAIANAPPLAVTDAGSTSSLNVTTTGAPSGTLTASLAGEIDVTRGGCATSVMSAGTTAPAIVTAAMPLSLR
jgi:hypothetical protein